MPTINQLPNAVQVSSADEVPISQSGITRNVSVGTLLATSQPVITIASQTLLGRVSLGAGGPEPVTLGTGVALANGAVAATGADHAGFDIQSNLTLTDELILNSNGQPRRMPVSDLLGLYQPGANVTISASGVIAAGATSGAGATGPIGPVGPDGSVGATGATGASGPVGPTGAAGFTGATGQTGTAGAAGTVGSAGVAGTVGMAGPPWSPPKRVVTAIADTPGLSDDQGVIAYSNSQPVSVTVNDLGSLRVYDTLQIGTGSVSLIPGPGVTMMSQGKAVASVVSAYQGAAISAICTGAGMVFVIGNTQ